MTLLVSLLSLTHARVTFEPSIARRILFGAKGEDRYAVRRGAQWTWDHHGRLVDEQTQREIDRAVRRARPNRVATSPSS